MNRSATVAAVCVFAAIFLLFCGCNRAPKTNEVVIYSSIDDPYLRPLMQRFEKQTGIAVRIVTDTEANKSSALVERILAEKDRPQADVYWGNEIFHTINLGEHGAFDPYRPATASDVPARWRDSHDLYTDLGLRARMIAISTRTQLKDVAGKVRGMADLADPALKGKVGVSHPAFGTASGHFAALYILWGKDKFETWLRGLRANDIKLLGGNSAVADQVAAGTLAAGPTDNDDVNNAKSECQPLDGVVPDQEGVGTLLIPGTVALIHNAQHPDNAKKMIDFICDPAIEKELIAGRYLAYSVRDTGGVKGMDVDYVRVAHAMKEAVELSLTILQERKLSPASQQ
jgi:iron(III) transport system substrate-binding protein